MSFSNTKNALTDNYLAGEDLSQYDLVIHSTAADQTVLKAADGTAYILGIAKCDVVSGKRVDVQESGTVEIILSEDVTAGAALTAAAGEAAVATAGDYVIGYAKQAGVTGERISIQLKQFKI